MQTIMSPRHLAVDPKPSSLKCRMVSPSIMTVHSRPTAEIFNKKLETYPSSELCQLKVLH
jgi:hypothetical protein